MYFCYVCLCTCLCHLCQSLSLMKLFTATVYSNLDSTHNYLYGQSINTASFWLESLLHQNFYGSAVSFNYRSSHFLSIYSNKTVMVLNYPDGGAVTEFGLDPTLLLGVYIQMTLSGPLINVSAYTFYVTFVRPLECKSSCVENNILPLNASVMWEGQEMMLTFSSPSSETVSLFCQAM